MSNNVYTKRLFGLALIKGFIIPLAFIVLILECLFYSGWQELLIAIGTSVIIITLCILYKVKPLSREEYLKDPSVRVIIKVINGRVL